MFLPLLHHFKKFPLPLNPLKGTLISEKTDVKTVYHALKSPLGDLGVVIRLLLHLSYYKKIKTFNFLPYFISCGHSCFDAIVNIIFRNFTQLTILSDFFNKITANIRRFYYLCPAIKRSFCYITTA